MYYTQLLVVSVGLGVLLILPALWYARRGRFDFFHPLVFHVLWYMVPAFSLGGIFLALGGAASAGRDTVMWFIDDPERRLVQASLLVSLGFAGLVLGYALPLARVPGARVRTSLERLSWNRGTLIGVLLLLWGLGSAVRVYAYSQGLAGYAVQDQAVAVGGLVQTIAAVATFAAHGLWLFVFIRRGALTLRAALALALAGQVLLEAALSGRRSTLVFACFLVASAFVSAGRRVRPRTVAAFGLLAGTVIVGGINVATVYREIKGTEQVVGVAAQVQVASAAVREVANRGVVDNAIFAGEAVLARFETLSQLAVVITRYRAVEGLEARYGLANNIWTYTWTAFVPRFVWPGKPLVSDARLFSEIYFENGSNSFAMTVFGDLLRNFGPYGVPLGMCVLGIGLRFLFEALGRDRYGDVVRSGSYYVLLSTISYESFYGTLLPLAVRMVVMLSLVVSFMALFSRTRAASTLPMPSTGPRPGSVAAGG